MDYADVMWLCDVVTQELRAVWQEPLLLPATHSPPHPLQPTPERALVTPVAEDPPKKATQHNGLGESWGVYATTGKFWRF